LRSTLSSGGTTSDTAVDENKVNRSTSSISNYSESSQHNNSVISRSPGPVDLDDSVSKGSSSRSNSIGNSSNRNDDIDVDDNLSNGNGNNSEGDNRDTTQAMTKSMTTSMSPVEEGTIMTTASTPTPTNSCRSHDHLIDDAANSSPIPKQLFSMASSGDQENLCNLPAPTPKSRHALTKITKSENVDEPLKSIVDNTQATASPVATKPMNASDLVIPTPAHPKQSSMAVFPHPLPAMEEAIVDPLPEQQQQQKENSNNDGDQACNDDNDDDNNIDDDDDDDDAFLPDDFKEKILSNGAVSPSDEITYTQEQLQAKIAEAESTIKAELSTMHEAQLKEFEEQAEQMLKEHTDQWKRDSDQEYERMDSLLKQERSTSQKQQVQLAKKILEAEDLREKLNESVKLSEAAKVEWEQKQTATETQLQGLQAKVADLEKLKDDSEHNKLSDFEKVNAEKQDADKLIEQLQAQLEQEKARSKAQLESLETEHAKALQSVETDLQSQLEVAKSELQSAQESHKEELVAKDQAHSIEIKSIEERHAAEIAQWQGQVTELKRQKEESQKSLEDQLSSYEGQIAKLKDEKVEEVDAVRSQLATLQAKLQRAEAEAETSSQASASEAEEKCRALQSEIDVLTVQLAASSTKYDGQSAELEQWRNQVTALQEKVEASEHVKLQLQSSISKLQQKHEEDILKITQSSQGDLERLQNDLTALETSAMEERSRLESQVQELQKEIKVVEDDRSVALKAARDEAKQEMEQALKNLETQLANMHADDSMLTNKLSALQASTEADKKEYEQKLVNLRLEHGKEMDEVLAQLDLVEAEHQQRMNVKERSISDKDAVISALGSQLAEIQATVNQSKDDHDAIHQQMESIQAELIEARSDAQNKKQEMELLKTHHERIIQDTLAQRNQAIEQAREEVIERVQVQFEERNAMYKELKHGYDDVVARKSELEHQLQSAEKLATDARKESHAREMDLADQLAQAKAAIATLEANVSRNAKQHLEEGDRLRSMEEVLRKELEKEKSTCQSIQSTLASVVADKERLRRECEELRAVSEELMTMVENHQIKP